MQSGNRDRVEREYLVQQLHRLDWHPVGSTYRQLVLRVWLRVQHPQLLHLRAIGAYLHLRLVAAWLEAALQTEMEDDVPAVEVVAESDAVGTRVRVVDEDGLVEVVVAHLELVGCVAAAT